MSEFNCTEQMAGLEEIANLEASISGEEDALESYHRESQVVQRAISTAQQRYQDDVDDLNIRRAEKQAELQSVTPELEQQLNELAAREAKLSSEAQRLQREALSPPGLSNAHR